MPWWLWSLRQRTRMLKLLLRDLQLLVWKFGGRESGVVGLLGGIEDTT